MNYQALTARHGQYADSLHQNQNGHSQNVPCYPPACVMLWGVYTHMYVYCRENTEEAVLYFYVYVFISDDVLSACAGAVHPSCH